MTIIDVSESLPTNPMARPWRHREVSQITRIAMHHSATPSSASLETLNRSHHARGWWKLSYHYAIIIAATVYKVNKATDITYTVANGNTPTLSVCLIGNFTSAPPPAAQWQAAIDLVRELVAAYGITQVFGHREVPTSPPQATACPGKRFHLDAFRAAVFAT